MKLIITGIVLVALVGCQMSGEDETVDGPADGADLTIATRGDELIERAVDNARADLAERLGISTAGMVVQDAVRVTWRDASRGCPAPDRSYTQALVPGVQVRLIVDGSEYRYHGGEDGQVFYCPAERAQTPTGTAVR